MTNFGTREAAIASDGTPSRVRELGGASCEAMAFAVTQHSCVIETDLSAGAEIWVTLGCLAPVRATIVANERGAAECEFYTPIDVLRLRSGRDRAATSLAVVRHKHGHWR
jgi:hypothetical protein